MPRNENRLGYKKTKVGWIPRDWDVIPLETIAKIGRGKFSARPRNDPRFYGGAYPFLQTGDVSASDGVVRSHSQTLNEAGVAVSRLFPSGTLLITIAANIGDVAEVPFQFACPDSLVAVHPREGANKLWLRYLLQTLKPRFRSKATQNAQANINLQTIRPVPVQLPPIPEQRAIADVLECWDKAIRGYERKIEKKRAIKKGLMQRLLSGKQRLPGFEGEWKEVRLGDVAKVNDQSLGNGTPPNFAFYYIDLTCVAEGRVDFPEKKIVFADSPSRARRRFKKNDVLMSAVRPNLLGHCYVDFESEDKVCSTGFAVISCASEKLDPRFFYAHLFGEKLNTDIRNLLAGSSYPAINSWDVENLVLSLPPIEEQQAIAEVLSAAASEITALEQKLALLKDQKRFLLSNLVTGTMRLRKFRVGANGDAV